MFVITEVIEKAEAMIASLKEIQNAHQQGVEDFDAYLERVEGIAGQITEVHGFLSSVMTTPMGEDPDVFMLADTEGRETDIDALLDCIMSYQDGTE